MKYYIMFIYILINVQNNIFYIVIFIIINNNIVKGTLTFNNLKFIFISI